MHTHKRSFIFLLFCLAVLVSCQQNKMVGPVNKSDTAPGVVDNIQVKNLHGGARITYSLPEGGSGLFYVEADYEIRPGVKQQVKSSYYNNFMVIQGFGDTSAHKVTLYTVDRAEKRSQPVVITVRPLLPPVLASYKTLEYDKDFGGIHATFQNENLADLVVSIMIKDSTGEWEDYDKYYSSLADNSFSVRGLPSVPTTFGLYIRDRWDNHSDTLIKDLTPIFETQLDKSKFDDMSAYLPGTPAIYSGSHSMPYMWDNDINDFYHTTQDVAKGAQFPLHLAFDLGTKAKLSRMKLWPRQGSWIYTHGNVKDMEIWGTNNPPGTWSPFSFDGWVKLAEYHCFKPSGMPVGTTTDADAEQAKEGQEVAFPISDPPVRYIMFNVIDNWSQPPNATGGFIHIAEISFWGQPQP